MRFGPVLFSLLALPLMVQAEYRVFSLRIGKYGSPPPYRNIQSTLAPRQYTEYYSLNPGEVIDYVDTWMCYGRGDYKKPLCQGPRDQNAILESAPPIGEGFHPWDPFPYQPVKDAGVKTRTPADDDDGLTP